MTSSFFDYSKNIDIMMRDYLKKIIEEVIEKGFPGDHHLFITFNTDFNGVKINDNLKLKYPEEMTFVLQHEYSDLELINDIIHVKLVFDDIVEKITIPIKSVILIHDPHANFSFEFLKLESDNKNPDNNIKIINFNNKI